MKLGKLGANKSKPVSSENLIRQTSREAVPVKVGKKLGGKTRFDRLGVTIRKR